MSKQTIELKEEEINWVIFAIEDKIADLEDNEESDTLIKEAISNYRGLLEKIKKQ